MFFSLHSGPILSSRNVIKGAGALVIGNNFFSLSHYYIYTGIGVAKIKPSKHS